MLRSIKRGFLHAGKWLGLFWVARRLTGRKLRILCYHGFNSADEVRFRPGLFIKPSTFRRRLEHLARKRFPVLPLGEALKRLQRGNLPRLATVITIDDGFHNVHAMALPLLESHAFPATVYVTSYYCQHPNPVFRLAVQYMFWKTVRSRISLDGLGVDGLRPGVFERAGDLDEAMWAIIRHGETACDEPGRLALSQALAERLGVDYDRIRQSRILSLKTPEELGRLGDSGIDCELHTHRHRFPDDEAEATREIAENRAVLKDFASGPLEHFCYPGGVWSERQWPWLDAAGVRSAVTCQIGLNDAATPPYALRRFLDAEDVSQIEFEAEMAGYLELLRKARSCLTRIVGILKWRRRG